MRRRPLLRAAVVGGVAHHAGRVGAENRALREQSDEARYAAPPAPAPSGGPTSDLAGQLRELAKLRDEGILTPEEFEQQKRALLGGG